MSTFRTSCLAILSLQLLAAPAIAQDTLPAGSPIEEALGADLTEAGMDYVLGYVGDFLPPDLVVGTVPNQEIADIWVCQENLELRNLVVHSDINSITVDGTPAALNLAVDVNVWINTPDDPAIVDLNGCIDYICLLYTDPAQLVLQIPITMALSADAEGNPFVDVIIGALSHNIQDAMQNKVHMTDCAIGDINEWLSAVGLNLFDLVIGQFVSEIESQVAEQAAGLEVTLEEAMRNLWLSDTTDVMGTELAYDLHPTDIDHNDHGLRLVMGGSVSSPPARCVAGFPDAGSAFTSSDMPAMTPLIPGTDQGYHAAALASDDLVNQAAYAAWRGGVLCYVVADLGDAPLTTTYLSLLVGVENEEGLATLAGLVDDVDNTPMLVRTLPESPPVARFDGPHDIDVDITGLNIEFYPVVYDRFANLASIAIDIAAGIDISLAEDDALQIDVFLDTEHLNPRVTYNELAPSLDEALEQNFDSFVGVVIDMVAGSYLEGMKFALPTFSGMGLVGLDVLEVGESPTLLDFLGAYALIGETDGGEGDGCDSCGGSEGCTGSESCGGEEGCGTEEGCDIESMMGDSGCSGESTEQPDDTGCQNCRFASRRVSEGHWRIVVGPGGARGQRVTGTLKVGLRPVLVALLPLLFLARRRRGRTA